MAKMKSFLDDQRVKGPYLKEDKPIIPKEIEPYIPKREKRVFQRPINVLRSKYTK